MLGHIVSKEGVKIDPERVETILRISLPKNKKGGLVFLGKDKFPM